MNERDTFHTGRCAKLGWPYPPTNQPPNLSNMCLMKITMCHTTGAVFVELCCSPIIKLLSARRRRLFIISITDSSLRLLQSSINDNILWVSASADVLKVESFATCRVTVSLHCIPALGHQSIAKLCNRLVSTQNRLATADMMLLNAIPPFTGTSEGLVKLVIIRGADREIYNGVNLSGGTRSRK